jgi:DNA-binding NtrC family response regulator
LFLVDIHLRLLPKILPIISFESKVFKKSADKTRVVNIAEVFPGKTRILIVDDDSDLRLTLCEYLESRNFSVSSARNGAEAISLLQSRKLTFDIVFTDLVMPPGPDGMEVLKVAKRLNPCCYVVVMTGYSSIETAIESIRCGAFDYLAKPFQLAQIEIVANRILEYLNLIDDNKRLSTKLALLTEKSTAIDSRLARIESLLSSLVAKVPT